MTPQFSAIYKKYAGKGLHVYAICNSGTEHDWLKKIKKYKLNWINVSDIHVADHSIGMATDFRNDYNLLAVPGVFLLNAKKKIIARDISPQYLDQFLTLNLTQNSSVKTTITPK